MRLNMLEMTLSTNVWGGSDGVPVGESDGETVGDVVGVGVGGNVGGVVGAGVATTAAGTGAGFSSASFLFVNILSSTLLAMSVASVTDVTSPISFTTSLASASPTFSSTVFYIITIKNYFYNETTQLIL